MFNAIVVYKEMPFYKNKIEKNAVGTSSVSVMVMHSVRYHLRFL